MTLQLVAEEQSRVCTVMILIRSTQATTINTNKRFGQCLLMKQTVSLECMDISFLENAKLSHI